MIGTIIAIIDHGSVVQFFIERSITDEPEHFRWWGRNEDGGLDVGTGDGNLTRRALADSGVRVGDLIEYEINDWGGLEGFSPLE